jgi:hypothetical protein
VSGKCRREGVELSFTQRRAPLWRFGAERSDVQRTRERRQTARNEGVDVSPQLVDQRRRTCAHAPSASRIVPAGQPRCEAADNFSPHARVFNTIEAANAPCR